MEIQEIDLNSLMPARWSVAPHTTRLFSIMAWWWQGWSLSRIATETGLSPSRVGAILGSVGCHSAERMPVAARRAGSRRGAPTLRIEHAHGLLDHPLARRLTARQRAAAAWTAQGLASGDVAYRMGVAPQRVRYLLISGQRRLERLTRRVQTPTPTPPHLLTAEADEVGELSWEGWEACVDPPAGAAEASVEVSQSSPQGESL